LNVQETNRYTERYIPIAILKIGVRNWKPVSREQVYATLVIYISVGIIQKPRENSQILESFLEDIYIMTLDKLGFV
jgi:hypothetical protein